MTELKHSGIVTMPPQSSTRRRKPRLRFYERYASVLLAIGVLLYFVLALVESKVSFRRESAK